MDTHRADRNELIGVVHHSNKKVEQDNDVDHGKGAKHQESKEPGELLNACEFKVVKVDEAKNGPKQSLAGFPQAK